MLVEDFDYELPPELIAQTPAEPRDSSRLLVLDPVSGAMSHERFRDLGRHLEPGDALILNDTRVLPSRLLGRRRPSGGKAEVFLLRHVGGAVWESLVRPGRRLRPGAAVDFGDGQLTAEVMAATDFGGRLVRFAAPDGDVDGALARLGSVPLPPYIHEELADGERYQTVYSREPGSAAAPTAGLHFTPELLAALRGMGVRLGWVTLHVGLGTFRPVTAERVEDHAMHREWYSVGEATAALIGDTRAAGHRVVAVGTTTVRTLESAADPEGRVAPGSAWTGIFIRPGYRFRVVDALVTNFHLPKSTLVMLVSAMAGRELVLAAYAEAVRRRYRFFSFGDAMLVTRRAP